MVDIIDENLNDFAYGTVLLLISLVVGKFFSYLFRIFVARSSVSDYGLFSLGITILSILTIFVLMGLDRGVIKFVSFYKGKKDDDMVRSFINTSFKITIISSIIFAVILFLLSDILSLYFFKKPGLAIILKIFSVLLPFFVISQLSLNILAAYRKIKYIMSISILGYLLSLILFIVLIMFNIKSLGATLAYTIAFILLCIFSIFAVKTSILNKLAKKKKDPNITKILLKFSSQIMFNNVIQYFIISLDTILIGYFLTSTDVGIYSAAYITSSVLLLLPGVLLWIFVPTISELFAKNMHKESKEIFQQVSRWIFFTGIMVVSFVLFFSKTILISLFGNSYIGGYLTFILLSIAVLFSSMSFAESKTLEISNYQIALFYYLLISLIINLLMNIILIPKYGILGSALSALATFFVYSSLCVYKCRKELKITQQFQKYIIPTITSLFSSLIIYYTVNSLKIPPGWIMLVILAAIHVLICLILWWLLKSINNKDLQLFKNIFSRLSQRSNVASSNKQTKQ